MELRSLRKNAIELEEHSALLQNHVDKMESVVADLEQEVELTKVPKAKFLLQPNVYIISMVTMESVNLKLPFWVKSGPA